MREVGISFIVQGTLVEPVSVQEMLNSALWAKCGSVVHFSFGAKGSTTTEQNYSVLTSAAIIISLFFVLVFCFLFVFICLFLLCCHIICADLSGTALALLIPTSLPPASSKIYSVSRPRPQRTRGGDVRSVVGCHPKKTLHCCQIIALVFNDASSDSVPPSRTPTTMPPYCRQC